MYCPARFAQPDSTSLHDLIAAHPLGMLVTHSDGLPDAAVSDAPKDYIEGMLNAIVGIEIVIDRIEGKWKTEPPPRVRATPGGGAISA